MKSYLDKNHSGFTLIELLVVIAIIGILSAIAIPQYSEYRINAFNAMAQSDLRNVVSAEEAYYSDNEIYQACSNDCDTILPGFKFSDGVDLNVDASGDSFSATSTHVNGDRTYEFDTTLGFSESSGTGGGASGL